PPGRQGPLPRSHAWRREHRPASGGAPAVLPLPLALRPLRPWLVVMAAAASLSPEELLPKGGSGKAEELEDELEEEDDDEEGGAGDGFCLRRGRERREQPSACKKQLRNWFLFLTCSLLPRFSRAALWIGTTSFMILVLPVVFETEKLQMEQQQQLQQRQILLGPNTGLSGGMPGALPPLSGKI
ncbi:TOM22 protein, partial [Corythaixoides concolor]|nr:TOM22 protein [Corythaixoides concolor]